MTASRSGRRPGNPDTRAAILHAARNAFAQRGFAATSIRKIAADAGVDGALIHHYFGTKQQLFLATMQIEVDIPAKVLRVAQGDPAGVGVALMTELLQTWDSPEGTGLISAFRTAIADPQSVGMIRDFLGAQILGKVLSHLGYGPGQSMRRANLVASQVLGIVTVRYLLALEPLASMPAIEVIHAVAPTIQRYVTGDIWPSDPVGQSAPPEQSHTTEK